MNDFILANITKISPEPMEIPNWNLGNPVPSCGWWSFLLYPPQFQISA